MICGLQFEDIENDLQNTTRRDTLGCCANGLSLISKAVINPAVDASTPHLYQICFGRLLELPVDSNNLIQCCDPVKRPKYASRYETSSLPGIFSAIFA